MSSVKREGRPPPLRIVGINGGGRHWPAGQRQRGKDRLHRCELKAQAGGLARGQLAAVTRSDRSSGWWRSLVHGQRPHEGQPG